MHLEPYYDVYLQGSIPGGESTAAFNDLCLIDKDLGDLATAT